MLRAWLVVCLGFELLFVAAPGAKAADAPAEPRSVPAFELHDHLGAKHRLDEYADKQAVVIAFLGTECPLAKLYGPRLAELAAEFEPRGIAFLGINSNQQDTLAEIGHYARETKIAFPLLKDPGNRVADEFGARRTPEVFVLGPDRQVLYHGRIDDQYGVGYSRPGPENRLLAQALDEILAGKPVSQPDTQAVGCHIGRVERDAPTGDITYGKHIAGIFKQHCTNCHREGQIAPFALTSYADTQGWAETIAEVIEEGRMPPWHADPEVGSFKNDARLPEADRKLVLDWVRNGAPEGEPIPPIETELPQTWRIPKPDVVYQMPKEFKVPAKGVVPYKYFVLDPGFTEDKWVRASEARPGNLSVVHHLILFFQPPGQERLNSEAALVYAVAAFAPGMPAWNFPPGIARRVPAGSKLVFQLHYTPNGTEQIDLSEAGLVFADPAEVEKELHIGAAYNFQFRIPAGDPNYEVKAERQFGQDVIISSVLPHMHLRGKSFRFDLRHTDGRVEHLLNVPRYDFNWQNAYLFNEPKRAEAGAVLECTAHFDNSAQNLVNPDPKSLVMWGDQTWQEMMVGSFDWIVADQDLRLGKPVATRRDDGRYDVRFRYRPSDGAKQVSLAGAFNGWDPAALPMTGPDAEGRYEATLELGPGEYEYKFVVNGDQWKSDPGNPDQTGQYRNSLLKLAP
ncbi:MAG: redoxin domain-containing protein [Pirellulales bacterium]